MLSPASTHTHTHHIHISCNSPTFSETYVGFLHVLSFTYFFYMEVHSVDSAIKISPLMKVTQSKIRQKFCS